MKSSNHSIQRTGASRSASPVVVAQRRLAPAADAECYMRVANNLLALVLILLTACSTGRTGASLSARNTGATPEAGPTGIFGDWPVRLWLNANGTYVAQHSGGPEFWPMIEGNRVYPQRINYPPEKGLWTWDRKTGELTLTPKTAPEFRWPIEHLHFDPASSNRLGWGESATLERTAK